MKSGPLALLLVGLLLAACSTAPKSAVDRARLRELAEVTIDRFKEKDPTINRFFEEAHGWAVFPTIAKGAIGIGGAHGHGVLYEKGKQAGYCDVSQGTIGIQLGGQGFSQIIFFQFERSLEDFKGGTFEFAAQASAVAVRSGGAATADYESGVAAFAMAKGGFMFEASIGGQNFDYIPFGVLADAIPEDD